MAASLGLSWTHRQDRLGPIQRLNLALLIDTKHQSLFGWRHVEPNDVPHLFDKQRVRRKLEGFDAVRLQTECLPNPVNRRRRMAHRLSHGTQRPVGCTTRCCFQRQTDRFGNLIIADLARPPRPQLIQKSVKPAFRIAAPPFADCVRIDSQRRTNLFVLQTFRSKQDNPSPTGQALRRPTATRETLKFLPFLSRPPPAFPWIMPSESGIHDPINFSIRILEANRNDPDDPLDPPPPLGGSATYCCFYATATR